MSKKEQQVVPSGSDWEVSCPFGHRSLQSFPTRDYYACESCEAVYEGSPCNLSETPVDEIDPAETFLHPTESGSQDIPDDVWVSDKEAIEKAMRIAKRRGGWRKTAQQQKIHVPAREKAVKEILCGNRGVTNWTKKPLDAFPTAWTEEWLCEVCLGKIKGVDMTSPKNKKDAGKRPEDVLEQFGFR